MENLQFGLAFTAEAEITKAELKEPTETKE